MGTLLLSAWPICPRKSRTGSSPRTNQLLPCLSDTRGIPQAAAIQSLVVNFYPFRNFVHRPYSVHGLYSHSLLFSLRGCWDSRGCVRVVRPITGYHCLYNIVGFCLLRLSESTIHVPCLCSVSVLSVWVVQTQHNCLGLRLSEGVLVILGKSLSHPKMD
jgi:hypothetical protein